VLIEHADMAGDAYVAHLGKLISDAHLTASGSAEDWANESHNDAQLTPPSTEREDNEDENMDGDRQHWQTSRP
jgi:hypothetical protein